MSLQPQTHQPNQPKPIRWPDRDQLEKPRYLGLARWIERSARQGQLRVGERLPPQRTLAFDVGVTVGTVGRAYELLAKWGTVRGEIGRGTFISGDEPKAIELTEHQRGRIDLLVNRPVLHGISEPFLEHLRQAIDPADVRRCLDYKPTQGGNAERSAARTWLASLGFDTPVERVMMTGGVHAAMTCTIMAMSDPGETVLVESLSYPGLKDIILCSGRRLEPIARNDDGIDIDQLIQTVKRTRARLLITTPNAHNPTSDTMDLNAREALADAALMTGITLIEDDVYGPLMDHGLPPVALLAAAQTIYLTGLSKLLAPGLRLGVAVADPGILDRLTRQQHALLCAQSSLAHMALTVAVDHDLLSAARDAQRAAIAEREARARRKLQGMTFKSSPECPHLWLELGEQVDPATVVQSLAAESILVAPGSMFKMRPGKPVSAIRIALGGADDVQTLDFALTRIADAATGRANSMTFA